MTTQNSEDVRRTSNTAVEGIKTSLLAALGAGNLAGQAVADAFSKAKVRVNESSEAARKNIEDLPTDMDSLRERLDPAELRKLLDEYTDSALRLYHRLAESGEETWERLVAQPQLKRGVEQLENVWNLAQEQADSLASEARWRVGDVMSRVSGRTREAGVRAGIAAEEATGRVADTVEEASDRVADAIDDAAPGASRAETPTKATPPEPTQPKPAPTTSAGRTSAPRRNATTRRSQGGTP